MSAQARGEPARPPAASTGRPGGPASEVGVPPAFRSARAVAGALAPAGPAFAGALALVILFWAGHLGVRHSVRQGDLLADAETRVALALVADDPAPQLARAVELLNEAEEPGMVETVLAVAGDRDTPVPARLDELVGLFSERRDVIHHRAERRFLLLAGIGMGLAVAGTAASALSWRRRWADRWDRVRRLSQDVEALARAPLDAAFRPSGAADEIGRIEQVLAEVAPRLADTLVHQQRLSLLGEQVAFIAHDLRNPLGTITMGLSLLPGDAVDPELRDLLVSEARRAGAMAEELRDFARRPNTVQPCSLAGEAEASARLMRSRAARAGVRVSVRTAGPATVLARSNEIRQVLVNLLENAIDAAAESPVREVSVSVSTEGEAVVIQVEDSGPGVPPGERDRLFESFYTRKEGGSGMGLAIARRIVTSLGGEIRVAASAELGGAAFVVRLPAATAGASLPAGQEAVDGA